MLREAAIERLEALLRDAAPASLVNQYTSGSPDLDQSDAPARRLSNLRLYLATFAAPRYLLCAEAAGYNGSRFSGITLVDETKLVGRDHLPWAGPAAGYQRSSAAGQPLHRELSATIVWRQLGERRDVALWNCIPWHPAGPGGPLSNRPPTPAERTAGLAVLDHVLRAVWPQAEPLAVGRVAQAALAELGYPAAPALRHPANGGARLFADGLARYCAPPSDQAPTST